MAAVAVEKLVAHRIYHLYPADIHERLYSLAARAQQATQVLNNHSTDDELESSSYSESDSESSTDSVDTELYEDFKALTLFSQRRLSKQSNTQPSSDNNAVTPVLDSM